MNSILKLSTQAAVVLSLLGLPSLSQAQVSAVPSALNFQGRLATPNGNPVPDGTYSILFSLYDAVTGGNLKYSKTVSSVNVKNGTFAVTLDTFPAGTFNGNLWLEVKIGNDAALAPRTPLVSVPYAFKAGSVADGSLTSASFASGALTQAFNGLAWLLGGNAGTNPASQFMGTTDNQPLVLRTNNAERLRLDIAGNVMANGNLIVDNANSNNGAVTDNLLRFGAFNSGEGIGSKRTASGNQYGLDFYTLSNLRMTITGNGNVGIGTASPAAKLHVSGGVSDVGVFVGDLSPFGQAGFLTNLSVSSTHAWFAENGNRVFSVTAGGNGYFAGNVGIGTTNPGAPLEVRSNALSFQVLPGNLFGTPQADAVTLDIAGINGTLGIWDNLSVIGSVGIGTSTPASRLSVNGGIGIAGGNVLRLGEGVAGQEISAGTIGYQTYTTGALDIVGAGTSAANRKIKFWNEGGATFAGTITVPGFVLPTGAGAGTVLVSDANGNGTWGQIGAAAIANGSITAAQLASGVIPSSLPPSGNAGGDLTGTYPNPTIATSVVNSGKLAADSNSLTKVSAGTLSFLPSGEVFDQKQETSGTYYAPNSAVTLKQVFTAGLSGTMTAIDINCYAYPLSYDAATLSVYQSGALTGGTLLSQQPISIPNSQGFQHIELASPLSITSGTQYRWELATSDGKIIALTGPSSAYSGGSSNAPTGTVYTFRTSVQGSSVPALAVTPAAIFYNQVGIETTAPQAALDVNGNIKCITLTQTSDARYKTHIIPLDTALDKILALRGVAYEYDRQKWPDKRFPEGTQIGFLAQELERIFPELVTTDANGYKAVNYTGVIPALVEAVKAQQRQIDDKQKQIDALHQQLDALKAQNAKLDSLQLQIDALRTERGRKND